MFNINFLNLLISLLSPDKRSNSIIALMKPVSNQLQMLSDDMFIIYKTFQSQPDYNNTTTYSLNDVVKYNKAIYRSLSNNNIYTPDNSNYWIVISPNYLGVDTRIVFNSTKIMLEYALNLWFDTTYVDNPGVSEIYITLNNTLKQTPFILGKTELKSSNIFTTGSDSFIGLDYDLNVYNGFTIHIPTAVYTALGSTAIERESTVRTFVNKYVNVGIFYDIQTY